LTNSPINPVFDFVGTGPVLHFANANGYPPAAYTPLFEHLTPNYHVMAMHSRPLQPGADPAGLRGWSELADELIEFLDQAGARGWVGVGHSLGAVVTVLAALRRPELFRALVAIEPVFFNPLKLMAYDVFRSLGLAGLVHPLVRVTRRRRRTFASAGEMYGRYRLAPVFSRIDDRGLRAYVDAAARPRADGEQEVELVITPEWEARIYATGPFNLWPQLGRLSVPLLVIRGAESDAFDRGALKALRNRLPKATLVDVPSAGHLLPLEKPAVVAQLILDFVPPGPP
jgi:pimeloyl-ACP methyl ester carboxylesterase